MNKVLLTIIALTLLVSVAGATTQTIGGTSTSSAFYNYAYIYPITATSNGTLNYIGLNIASGGGGAIRLAIYNDVGGYPYTLLGETASTPTVTGWNNLTTTTPVTIVTGTTYWIALQNLVTSASLDQFYTGASELTRCYKLYSYSAYPNPFAYDACSMDGHPFNMLINYTGGITTTSTTTSTSVSTTTSSVTATTDCVTHAPTAYGAYSVVTIDNTQSTATNVSSQQQINLTESSFAPYLVYNNNYANFGYYYQNGTNVTAWIESNVTGKLVTWAKINPSISGISSMDICLGFASTNLLSSSGITGIGEAPQLSSTYAQYDNGANVFPLLYDNFAGVTLNTGIWGGANSGNYIVSNGLTITGASSGANGQIQSSNTFGQGSVFDMYGSKPFGSSNYGGIGFESAGYTWWANGANWVGLESYNNNLQTASGGTTQGSTTTNYATSTAVWSIGYSPTNSYSQTNYANTFWASDGTLSTSMAVAIEMIQGASSVTTASWARVRTAPPSGVMPSDSFGSLTAISTTTTIPTTTSVSTSTSSVTTTIPTTTSVSTSTSSVTTTIPTTTSVSTSTSSVTTTIPTTTSVSTTTSTSVPITFTTTINPRNSTLVNATTACKDLPCVLSYSFAIPEISLIFVFVAFGIAWQVTHKLINGLASALIVAIVMVGIAPTLLNIGVLVVIGFFVVLGYYTHAFERKSD